MPSANTLEHHHRRSVFLDFASLVQTSRANTIIHAKQSPFSDQQDHIVQTLADGVPVNQPSSSSSDQEDDRAGSPSSDIAVSDAYVGPPTYDDELQDAILFHMNDVPLRVRLSWTDYHQMVHEIAGHYSVPRVQIEDVYEVVAAVDGIAEGVVPIIARMTAGHPLWT